MEFNNRLYELRKQKGLSQEELANRLNVSRQTVSKWEIGDSTPDMEKLVALSDLFEVSIDELVTGKVRTAYENTNTASETLHTLEEKILTPDNKKKAKHFLKIGGIILGVVLIIDIISFLVYFFLFGFPK